MVAPRFLELSHSFKLLTINWCIQFITESHAHDLFFSDFTLICIPNCFALSSSLLVDVLSIYKMKFACNRNSTNLNSNIIITHMQITLHHIWPHLHMKESLLHLWSKFGCSGLQNFKRDQKQKKKNNLNSNITINSYKNNSTWLLISLTYQATLFKWNQYYEILKFTLTW